MRISVISAAVCCALFPLISVSAAGLSVEQRLAQLEARLNLAGTAGQRGQPPRAAGRTANCRRRAARRGGGAAGAGAQPADHGSRTKTAGH